MAVEKKIKKNLSKPKIQVVRNRDNGKRIADSFARLRNEEHPLDIIQDPSLEAESLDSQIKKVGYPNEETLDSNIAKDTVWIAKNEPVLDSNICLLYTSPSPRDS